MLYVSSNVDLPRTYQRKSLEHSLTDDNKFTHRFLRVSLSFITTYNSNSRSPTP